MQCNYIVFPKLYDVKVVGIITVAQWVVGGVAALPAIHQIDVATDLSQ